MILISYHEVIHSTFWQNKLTQNQISVKEPLQRYPVALESFRISETFIQRRLHEMSLACWCCCRGDLVTHKALENSTDFGCHKILCSTLSRSYDYALTLLYLYILLRIFDKYSH